MEPASTSVEASNPFTLLRSTMTPMSLTGRLAHKLLSPGPYSAATPSRSMAIVHMITSGRGGFGSDDEVDPDEEKNRLRGGGGRGISDAWVDHEGSHARIDLPGLDKDHVKIWIDDEGDGLVYRAGNGESKKSKDFIRSDSASGGKYGGLLSLRPGTKESDIRAEMKNGVLHIIKPL